MRRRRDATNWAPVRVSQKASGSGHNPTEWKISATHQTAPNAVELDLSDPTDLDTTKPAATILYEATPAALHFTLRRLRDGFGWMVWPLGPDVLAAESLARPGFGFKRLPGTGLVTALPST